MLTLASVLLTFSLARPITGFHSSNGTSRGSPTPVEGFEKLDKYAHCDGEVDHYMVYKRNLGLTPKAVMEAGQDAHLMQQETVAIFGWTLGDFEWVNQIAWGKDNVTFGVEPFGFPHCTLHKAEVWPYIEVGYLRARQFQASCAGVPNIEVLVSGLHKLPPAQPGTLWRGSKRTAEQLGKVISGGFSSTSRNFDSAFNFVKGSGGSLWAIESHTSGRNISMFSDKPSEGEVLFPAGSSLEAVECSPTIVTEAIRQKVKEAETPSAKIEIICLKGIRFDSDTIIV